MKQSPLTELMTYMASIVNLENTMPKHTPREIDLLNLDSLAIARCGSLEFKLVQRSNGEWVAGTIRRTDDLPDQIIDMTHSTSGYTARTAWVEQIREQAVLSYQPVMTAAQTS